MNNHINKLSIVLMNLFVTAVAATIGGTILWLLWEGSVTSIFPTAVSSGFVAEKLDWWPAVKVVWICALLFKTTIENKQSTTKPEPKKEIL